MQSNIILAGVGGQGILTIAQVISTAAIRRGWTVKQAEVHGMSQRGGAVYSHVRVSDREIYSDLIPNGECDLIIAMEPLESLRYVGSLREDGQIVANTTPLVNITNYPAVEDLLDRICACSRNVLVDAERLARTAGRHTNGRGSKRRRRRHRRHRDVGAGGRGAEARRRGASSGGRTGGKAGCGGGRRGAGALPPGS